MFITPAPGRAARHPGTLRLLAAEGEHITPSPYWHRLIANGDVTLRDAPSTSYEVTVRHPTDAEGTS